MGYKAINKANAKKDLSARLKQVGLGFMQAGLLADRLIAKADHLGSQRGEPGEDVLARFLKAFEGDHAAVAAFGIALDDRAVEQEARKLNKLGEAEPVSDAQAAHARLQIIARS